MAACGISRLAAIGFTAVLALWLVVGCAGPQQQSAPPVAGSFVGEVPEADALVAVVAAGPQEAEGGEDKREVRAYLCDGNEINEWFTGTATENDLDLSSDGGSSLEGNLTPDTSTGQITLSDGRAFPFTAELAEGVAGLYDVTVTDDTATVKILRACRAAIADTGKLLVIEPVIQPGDEPDPAKFSDLNMLVMLGGQERTAEDFERLYAEAGFRLTDIIRTGSSMFIIEGVPV